MFLPTVVNNFPKYDSESLHLCLQLVLVLEILQYSPVQAINVFSFFPPSFSSKWMKGIYHIGTGTDVIHKNLQNKRTEVYYVHVHVYHTLQWNLHIKDTLGVGTKHFALFIAPWRFKMYS